MEIMVDASAAAVTDERPGIVPYLGAVARVDAAATAFPHRAPGYSLLIVSQWTDQRETEPNIAWAKELSRHSAPTCPAGATSTT